ncbi:Ig-like domain-containing protein [Streptomyces sp. NPDC048430]|uniref:Ig-like domain-containing protein n=1 Tax=unclassified Streptomyces TaxID=2593676 RepID=UPI003443E294
MNHLLCSGRAVGTERSQGIVYAGLYCSADPRTGTVPGEIVQLGLSVAADEGAPRGCAYVLESSLTDAAEILSVEALEYFPQQRWFRVRADPGETRTGALSLRIRPPRGAPRLRPQIMVAVPDAGGQKLIRTARLTGHSLPVLTHSVAGLRITTEPGVRGTANVLARAPQGSFAISVTQPLHGTAQLSRDGWVAYDPAPGFTGYDRFEYTVGTADSAKVTAAANIFVGDLGLAPGVFPADPAETGFQTWQWPELTGEMPWPRPQESPRNR